MSGYGGNLTYPDTKIFFNSLTVNDPSVEGDDLRVVVDPVLGNVLFIESRGESIPGADGAWSKIVHVDPTARVTDVVLENRAPCDDCTAELGFVVTAEMKQPGVRNDNFYGYRRSYFHRFERLDPIAAGLISDADLMRAYADIQQQITDDVGRGGANLKGNTEAIVDAVTSITFSGDVSGGTFDIPAAGIYGETLANVSDYISGTTTITNGGTTKPGYGFIVHPPGAETITSHKITLTTKTEYISEVTHQVSDVTGTFEITTEGNFETLPWQEVWREFTNMGHDVPLSNQWDFPKPDPALTWNKYILESNMGGAAIHGASHGNSYLQRVVMYVPTSADIARLETILGAWIA